MANTKANAQKATQAVKQKQAQKSAPKLKSAKAQDVPLSPQAVVVVNEKFRKPKDNPKRGGTGAHKRFALVQRFHNKTLAELTKEWKKQADQGADGLKGYSAGSEIGWCIMKGFVTLKQPSPQKEDKRQSARRKSDPVKAKAQKAPNEAPANPAPAAKEGEATKEETGSGEQEAKEPAKQEA